MSSSSESDSVRILRAVILERERERLEESRKQYALPVVDCAHALEQEGQQ